jgi:hypothetical protein
MLLRFVDSTPRDDVWQPFLLEKKRSTCLIAEVDSTLSVVEVAGISR